MMKLSALLQRPELGPLEISGLTLDSRKVKPGDCFFAIPGHQGDGRDFMAQAAEQAAAIVYDPKDLKEDHQRWIDQASIPFIAYPELAQHLSALAGRFYGNPSEDQHIIAVTGTNGKSSIVHGLNQLYAKLDEPVAMIGTLGVGVLSQLKASPLTTPDPIALQETLKIFRDQGIETVALEASSHALDQNRLSAIHIATALYTQLSRDHLDYHQTMEAYAQAKARLFHFKSVKQVVMNLDCPYFYAMIDEIPQDKIVLGVSLTGKTHPRLAAVLRAHDIQSSLLGQTFSLNGEGYIQTRLLGQFNVTNLLTMMAAMICDGFTLQELVPLIPSVETVPGRLEVIHLEGQPVVVVDYAHTPDALEKSLQALKPLCKGKLICVFGCGGDRDQGKRPLMGQVAARLADQLIVTDDNPRAEDPAQITAQILSGIKTYPNVRVLHARAQAIEQAILEAGPEDCILIAGKGHETYQILKDRTIDFSDKTVAQACLQSRRDR